MAHLFLEKAFRCKIPDDGEWLLAGYFYERDKGYWVNAATGQSLVSEDNANRPRTKKADIETGEDKKGE